MKKQKICVIGLGYIGLPTASILATKGHQVLGVDINKDIVDTINAGDIHIVEPDLDILVRSAVNSGNLKANESPQAADVFILAVPTPFKITGKKREPMLDHVKNATNTIAPYVKENNLIILESTVPVGTTEIIDEIITKIRPGLKDKIFIAHCPERVLPGHILKELIDNDRVIGGINNESAIKAKTLYESFCNGNFYLTSSRTAELIKLIENAYRDVNIAFANELSIICDAFNINVWEVINLANKHPRVNIHSPGPGVGGHCIAVDPWFIISSLPDKTPLMRTAREVNDFKALWVLEKIKQKAAKFKNPVIGCLGITYKANISDLRESPALIITKQILDDRIGEIMVCDPLVSREFNLFPIVDLQHTLRKSDILVILVDHNEFKNVDHEMLKEKVIIDTRGIWT